MPSIPRATRATWRLFAIYLAVTAVPVVALGLLLASGFRSEARDRGVRVGGAQAALIAGTAIIPDITGGRLKRPLSKGEQASVSAVARRLIVGHQVLRLRLRDPGGHVVFSDDGSGFDGPVESDAITAAHGTAVASLTRVNTDTNDHGRVGVAAVEVYLALRTTPHSPVLGVLETYLPYGPIAQDLSTGLDTLYRDLVIGLAALYLVLFVITASLSGRLRAHALRNAHLARYDTLTDLPNRSLFQARVDEAVRTAQAAEDQVTVATVDLDRFKEINDALGHRNGDRVLIELGHRLQDALRPGETVARLGGDEFGIILLGPAPPEDRLRCLQAQLEEEVEVAGLVLSAEASFGFVTAPDDGADADTLLQRTDVAMFAAKSSHAGVLRYHPDLDRFDAERLGLVTQLRRAIEDDQLVLHYQPQQNLISGRITAVEALLRWQHPTRGLLYPDTFLGLAEQTDVINTLTRWVLRRALADLRSLDPHGDLLVAVNVSARNLGAPGFAADVLAELRKTEVEAGRLILEVTETALMTDPARASAVLRRLADAGVAISLDDFGQGQTSLSYLSRLPLDELKLDRSFVADMLDDPAHAAIVRSMIDLGHNLGLRVVAEGVETEDTLAALKQARCDVVQGFLLARPMTLDGVSDILKRSRPLAPAMTCAEAPVPAGS